MFTLITDNVYYYAYYIIILQNSFVQYHNLKRNNKNAVYIFLFCISARSLSSVIRVTRNTRDAIPDSIITIIIIIRMYIPIYRTPIYSNSI